MQVKNPVLILFAHPALQKSQVHAKLITQVKNLEGVTFNDLYENYPDFNIDIEREKQLLEAHKVIILQHPLYWYSTPSILKEWQDLVLKYGWAYGKNGTALAGKIIFNVISAGGPEDSYTKEGQARFTIREYLAPVQQSMKLCHMEYLPPFVIHSAHALDEDDLLEAAIEYRRLVEAFRDGNVDLENAKKVKRMNEDVKSLILKPAGN